MSPVLRMPARWLTALLTLALSAGAFAQWTTPQVTAPGLQYRTFFSPTANATVSFHIYLPPEYTANPTARFPVLYWLHGSGSPTAGISAVRNWFSSAMSQGKIPPMLLVFPNGMGASMWCDSKDGTVPMESVVTDDLIPHVDANFRTIDARRGRIVEGFSMGGPGSARLGLRRTDLFGGISMLGAGPMQLDFTDAPLGTDVPPENRALLYERVWSSDPDYYLSEHPWTIVAEQPEAHGRLGTVLRIGCGEIDAMLPGNADFHQHLITLGVPHSYTTVPNVDHDALQTLQGLAAQTGWGFYAAALAVPDPQPADLDVNGRIDGGDLAVLLLNFGDCSGSCKADLDASGSVDSGDIALLLLDFEA